MIEFSNRSSRSTQRGRRRLIVATVVIILIAFFDVVSGGMVRSLVRLVAVDAYAVGSALSRTIGLSGILSTRAQLARENGELKSDLARLQDQVAQSAVLRQQNQEFRALLSVAEQSEGITVPLLSSFRASPFGTFLVGAGTNKAIGMGDIVETAGGFVIGRVSEVHSKTALVSQIFAPHASIDVNVGGAAATAEGQGGGNARLRVPHGVVVSVGDVVTAPEIAHRPIGVVGKVISNPADPYAEIYVRIPVNILSLQYVYVVSP